MLYGVSKRSFTGSMKRSGHTGQPTSGSPFLLPTTTAARFSFRRIYPVQPGYQANWQVLVSLTLGFICRRSLDRLQKADDGESALADGLWLVHPLPSRDDWSASAKQWAECQKNENNGKPSGSDRPAPAFPASDKAGLGFRVWAETTYGGSESVMKTVRDACQLQDNALSIKLSDQIEQLDELIGSEGDGAAFFEKTYIRGWITARWFSGFTSEFDFCTLPLYANSALQPDPGPNIVPYEASAWCMREIQSTGESSVVGVSIRIPPWFAILLYVLARWQVYFKVASPKTQKYTRRSPRRQPMNHLGYRKNVEKGKAVRISCSAIKRGTYGALI
jgi:hypothetical protein